MDGQGTIRIAVVGDLGVGKTSLIIASATESFPERPPPLLPPTRQASSISEKPLETAAAPTDQLNSQLRCGCATGSLLRRCRSRCP